MKPRLKRPFLFLVALIATAALSVAATLAIIQSQGNRVLNREEYQTLQQLSPLFEFMQLAGEAHYGQPTSEDAMLEGALGGAVNSLNDPYARYYSEEAYTAYLEQMKGTYHGIGVLVGQPEKLGVPVLKIYENSAAQDAGMAVGDLITAVGETPLAGLTLEDIELLFIGADGSNIEVDILREDAQLHFLMVRRTGMTQRVAHKLFTGHTGYIQIERFTGSAVDEFQEAIRDLTHRGMKSLVIDLRNNPGGELEQVVAIADALMGEGVIVTVRDANGNEEVYRSDAPHTPVPLAILVNENSASASEILAAAIKESGRGLVVGNTTYGKGVVQTTMQLKSNGGWVKMTTAAYYTPDGNNVDGVGVQPDIAIDLPKELKTLPPDQISQKEDAQLQAALKEVRTQTS